MRLLSLTALALSLATSVAAQGGRTDFTCSSQMLATVIVDMPPGTRELDPRDLSCLGLAQVYFIQTSVGSGRDFEERRRIEAVFRREGLTR